MTARSLLSSFPGYASVAQPFRRALLLLPAVLLPTLLEGAIASAAEPQEGEPLRRYIVVDAPIVALQGVQVFDGTGDSPRADQIVVIEGGMISGFGPRAEIPIPEGTKVLDLPGRTVIPGLVGTHNHLHMPGMTLLAFSAPRLYLASGVTTIQTTGSADPAGEAALARSIERGEVPGPTVIHTGPYVSGEGGNAVMIHPESAAEIERVVRRWVAEGATWFKAYRHISSAHLRDLIRIAHELGAKVTGHLCSVTYSEAATLGIDAVEHGFLHASDFAAGKDPGKCNGSREFRDSLAIDSEAVRGLHRTMIENGVALSSTLAIFEAQVPSRAIADARALDALSPDWVEAYRGRRERMAEQGDDWRFREAWLTKSMQFDRAFFEAGGLLTAGLDPGLHNLPGFGDQRNFELLEEAGFSIAEAIQVMTSNGAKLLEMDDRGELAVGKRADLVVLRGDLSEDPSAIRRVELVFKAGLGFDPEPLLADVAGQVGLR